MDKGELKSLLERASQAYGIGQPIMTDAEYDKLYEEFESRFPDDYIVGYKPTRERKLSIPMFSLNKRKSMEDVKKWLVSKLGYNIDDVELLLTPKYDGISICVDEMSSVDRRSATTRGDGIIGQNIDIQYSFMNTGDKEELHPIYSFGEAIMSKKKFSKYDKNNGGQYKNPRNLVGSQMNADKPNTSILRDIDYIRYGMSIADDKEYSKWSPGLFTRCDQLCLLNSHLNNVIVKWTVVPFRDISHDFIMSCYEDWSLEYEIDGIVIEINDLKLAESLGREGNNNPSYAIAYKGHFENAEVTEVQGVDWQVSKSGKLKPVVRIESVRLSGADVTAVTGYNARNIIDKGIGKGAIVSVKRSGAVIPKIVEVHNKCGDPEIVPNLCPSCNGFITFDTVDLICKNELCKDRIVSQMTFFFSTLKCKEVGRGTMEAFYDNGYKSVYQVLNATVEDISNFPKYGKKKSVKIYSEIHKCIDGITLPELMHASCCFEDIGSDTIKSIINNKSVGVKDMEEYNKGILLFNSFYEGIKKHVKITGEETAKTNKLANVVVVYTGFRDSSMEKVVVENGGEIGKSVSRKTTHLVVASVGLGTVKEQRAEELGIPIMTGSEFESYVNSRLE